MCKYRRDVKNKTAVVGLVEINGRVESDTVDRVTANNLKRLLKEYVDKTATIMTCKFKAYRGLHKEFEKLKVVNHSKCELVKKDCYTNTAKDYFILLKRGIVVIYHHVSKQHL